MNTTEWWVIRKREAAVPLRSSLRQYNPMGRHRRPHQPPLPPRQQMAADDAVEGDGVDRLSSLPQLIWAHILALLPTRDAVATGLLSRRWRRRWTQLPHLDLDPAAFYAADAAITRRNPSPRSCGATCGMPAFAAFVDAVLPTCAARRSLRRLTLLPACQCRDWSAGIDRWVRLAMAARQLTALELDFSRLDGGYALGDSTVYDLGPIAAPETLEELKLGSCGFDLSRFGTFAGLKALTLTSVSFHGGGGGDHVGALCPVLEALTVRGCSLGRQSLVIRHPRLRRLVVEDSAFEWMGDYAMEVQEAPELETLSAVGLLCCEAIVLRGGSPELTSLEVDNCYANKEEGVGVSLQVEEAPKLARFRLVGCVGGQCSVKTGGLLEEAAVEVYPWTNCHRGDELHSFNWVTELLRGISGARSLTLSGGTIQCLATDDMDAAPEATSTLPGGKFHSLVSLTLRVGLVARELPGIACLLRSCPLLQTLSISLDHASSSSSSSSSSSPSSYRHSPKELDYELKNIQQLYGDFWESQLDGPPIDCLAHRLKRVEISNYRGKQMEEELARFLVTNARVLKEMPISTPSSSFSGFDFL